MIGVGVGVDVGAGVPSEELAGGIQGGAVASAEAETRGLRQVR